MKDQYLPSKEHPKSYPLPPGRVGIMVVDLVYYDAWPGTPFDVSLRESGVDTAYYHNRITSSIVPAVTDLVEAVRLQGGPVLWVKPSMIFDNAHDWPRASRASRKGSSHFGTCRPGSQGFDLIPGLQADPADYVVPKKCVSAFWGGSAGSILRHCDVSHLLLTGCLTNYGVMVNAVDAANNNLQVTIIDDGCAALSDEVHQASLALHSQMYTVATAADIIPRLASSTLGVS
jgi:nicotinamidase-related amidase